MVQKYKTNTPAAHAARAGALVSISLRIRQLLPVLLDSRRAQAGETVAVDRILPGQELFDGQGITGAGLFERQEPAADRCDDLSLAANDPAPRAGSRQIGNGQGTAVRPDDVFHPRAMRFGHRYTHTY